MIEKETLHLRWTTEEIDRENQNKNMVQNKKRVFGEYVLKGVPVQKKTTKKIYDENHEWNRKWEIWIE